MAVNTEFPKSDLYRNIKFRLKWDGKYVAGFSKASNLKRTTDVITHRTGEAQNTPRHMLGQSSYQPITLERGVTHDVAFEQWANKVWDDTHSTLNDKQGGEGDKDASREGLRKNIVLEVYNEAGQKVFAYNIYRCWPSEFTALPEMDDNGNAVAIQSLKLENEGWERDTSVTEPTEPSFTLTES